MIIVNWIVYCVNIQWQNIAFIRWCHYTHHYNDGLQMLAFKHVERERGEGAHLLPWDAGPRFRDCQIALKCKQGTATYGIINLINKKLIYINQYIFKYHQNIVNYYPNVIKNWYYMTIGHHLEVHVTRK